MSSRIFYTVAIACALLASSSLVQQVAAIDRLYDGGVGGAGTDYYTPANWTSDVFPTAQFHARGVIGAVDGVGLLSPTVNVNTTPDIVTGGNLRQSGSLVLGRDATSTGTLNINNGGTARFAFTANAASAFTNGAVYLGLFQSGTGLAQGGIGNLNMSGNGTLIGTGMFVEGETVDTTRSTVSLSGNAVVTLGPVTNVFTSVTNNIGADNLRFGRNLNITGPNVNFTNTGNLNLLSTNTYNATITSATSHSAIKTTGNVALGGTLNVNFSGLVSNPAVGATWNLVDYGGNLTGNFSNATLGSDVTVTGLPQPVELGAAFKIRRANGGVNGKLVQLVQQALLVLEVNRDTGAASLTNPHGGAINIEGYRIGSPLGSLLSSYKGISGAPAGDTGWEKVPMNSATGLAELKPTPFTSLPVTTPIALGTVSLPAFDRDAVAGNIANFGTDGEDLVFFYDTPDGPVQGHIKYIGTKFENNLVLRVNPNTGEAFLKNDSLETLSFDGYSITSTTNSLDSLNWDGLGGTWAKTDIEPGALSETNLFGQITLAPGQQAPIGDIGAFPTAASQAGLSMEFILSEALGGGSGPATGDHNLDGTVDAADYVMWRKTDSADPTGYNDWRENFGSTGGAVIPEGTFRVGSIFFDTTAGSGGSAPVPEPGTLWLILAGIVGALTFGRGRGTSRQYAFVAESCSTTRVQVGVGGGNMLRRFGSHWMLLIALSASTSLVSAQPAAAAPEPIPLINYDFEDPGPLGVKAFAFNELGVPVANAIPGWIFTGPGTEDFGDDERLGDSGTEGSGGLVVDNEMLLSVNDGKAYQIASGFALRTITDDEIYKLAFDARDIFTIDANEAGLPDSGQLTARFFYGAWAVGERTLLNQVINLTGTSTRYEFTIPFNSSLLTAPALGQTIGIEFTTTSKDRNPLVDKSWSHIDNVVMEIAPVLPGDFDGNGAITTADYNILRNNIQRASCDVGIRGCPAEADGEMTGDYVVDLNDFRAFKTAFEAAGAGGGSGESGNVPEPATAAMAMLAASVFALAKRHRTNQHSAERAWARALLLAVVASGAFLASESAQAELYVYDPFLLPSPLTNPANPALGQYNEWTPPPGGATEPYGPHVPLAGQNPTPQFGTRPNYFEGQWRTAGAAPGGVVHPTGIGYITTTVQGGSARIAPVPNAAYTGPATSVCGSDSGALYSSCDGRTARFLTTPYDAAANETVYIAFMANFGETEGDMGYRAVEFFPSTSAPASDWSETRIMELGYNQFFGYGSPTQQNPTTAKLGLGTGGTQVILADAPTSYNDDGRNHLFVMRFEFSNQNNLDNVFIFMDPASTEEPEIANAEFRNINLTLGAISTVTRYGGTAPSLANMGNLGSGGIFDELRIGNSYADVLPPGLPVPGDTDGDEDVDMDDYETIRDNFHRTDAGGPADGDVARSDGRLGFDGKVDQGDFWLWKREFEEALSGSGGGGGNGTIPEPSTALLTLVAASLWVGSLRRRKACIVRES